MAKPVRFRAGFQDQFGPCSGGADARADLCGDADLCRAYPVCGGPDELGVGPCGARAQASTPFSRCRAVAITAAGYFTLKNYHVAAVGIIIAATWLAFRLHKQASYSSDPWWSAAGVYYAGFRQSPSSASGGSRIWLSRDPLSVSRCLVGGHGGLLYRKIYWGAQTGAEDFAEQDMVGVHRGLARGMRRRYPFCRVARSHFDPHRRRAKHCARPDFSGRRSWRIIHQAVFRGEGFERAHSRTWRRARPSGWSCFCSDRSRHHRSGGRPLEAGPSAVGLVNACNPLGKVERK